jgi:hypothetical protein
MNSNLTTSYMALQAERARLDDAASRGWLAEQAATSRSRQPVLASARRHAGVMLIALGERLHGASVPAGLATKTAGC